LSHSQLDLILRLDMLRKNKSDKLFCPSAKLSIDKIC